jgi:hypothetical protein
MAHRWCRKIQAAQRSSLPSALPRTPRFLMEPPLRASRFELCLRLKRQCAIGTIEKLDRDKRERRLSHIRQIVHHRFASGVFPMPGLSGHVLMLPNGAVRISRATAPRLQSRPEVLPHVPVKRKPFSRLQRDKPDPDAITLGNECLTNMTVAVILSWLSEGSLIETVRLEDNRRPVLEYRGRRGIGTVWRCMGRPAGTEQGLAALQAIARSRAEYAWDNRPGSVAAFMRCFQSAIKPSYSGWFSPTGAVHEGTEVAFCSFLKARTSIWRTRSREIP